MGEPEERHDEETTDGSTDEPGEAPEAPETPTAEDPAEAGDVAAEPVVIDAEEVEVVAEKSEADKLREQLDATSARLRTVSKAYTDLQNEMQAFRNRMEHQGNILAERQAFDAVSAFLDPVQNLKRSIAAPGEDIAGLVSGLGMVHKQFMDALHKLGLEEVPGEGAPFDPKYHEALAVMPVTDPAQDGKVLVVHQGGYVVKGKVLQAAQVVIGKHEAPAAEA